MKENTVKAAFVLGGGVLLVLFLLLRQPDYLASSSSLAMLIGVEIVMLAIARFTRFFFPLVIATFLAAGIQTPTQSAFIQARWVVLGIGAVVGLAMFMKSRNHRFGAFHLIALFCILSAAVSASVSAYPSEARLKALSLGLLLVYAGAGARISASGFRAQRFFRGVLIGCELLTWFAAVCYFIFRWEIFGNANSLGAIAGVVLVPTLLWGVVGCEPSVRRTRLGLELGVASLLLMSSFSRAGISSALITFFILCLSLRRYRLMVKGFAGVIVLAICAISFVPRPTGLADFDKSQNVGEVYLYKGKMEAGVLGSRRSVWRETWDSIKQDPWFGSGFGTSKISGDRSGAMRYASHHINSWIVREHGNSYLAIAEWTGLLGVLPFYALIVLTSVNTAKVFTWLRRTGSVVSPVVPAAMIVAAGLIDATFEDWMFAVGYYLSVFFWVAAFILDDACPERAVVLEPAAFVPMPGDSLPLASGQ